MALEGMLSKPTLPFSDAGSLSTAAATATRSLTAAVTAVRVEPGWHGWRLPFPPNPVTATGWVALGGVFGMSGLGLGRRVADRLASRGCTMHQRGWPPYVGGWHPCWVPWHPIQVSMALPAFSNRAFASFTVGLSLARTKPSGRVAHKERIRLWSYRNLSIYGCERNT